MRFLLLAVVMVFSFSSCCSGKWFMHLLFKYSGGFFFFFFQGIVARYWRLIIFPLMEIKNSVLLFEDHGSMAILFLSLAGESLGEVQPNPVHFWVKHLTQEKVETERKNGVWCAEEEGMFLRLFLRFGRFSYLIMCNYYTFLFHEHFYSALI